MGSILHEHFDIVFSLGVAVFITTLSALRAWYLKKRSERVIIGYSPELRFTYPPVEKWLLGFGGVFFLTCAMLSALYADDLDDYFPLGCVGAGLLSLGVWYRFTGEVVVDSEGIALNRLGRETRIRYPEVTKVTEHRLRHCVVIHAGRKRIRIEKQLEEYPKFMEAVEFYYRRVQGSISPEH